MIIRKVLKMINRLYFVIFSLVLFLHGANNNSVKSLIKTAKIHEQRDDYNSAILIYEDLLKGDPYHRQSLRNLKSIYKNEEKYIDGIQFLEKRIKTLPNDFNNYSDLGEFYYLNNQTSNADSIWLKGIKKFKSQRPFYRIMLSLYGKYNLNEQISNLLNFGRIQFGNSFLAYEAGIYFQSRSAYEKSLDQFLLYLINEPEQNGIIERRVLLMSDDETPDDLDIQQVVEALLNICGQAAEMQIDEDSRTAIYDMCDAVAAFHDIPRFDAVIEEQDDGSSRVSYYGKGVAEELPSTKPKLRLVVDNPEEDDPETIH